MTNASIMSGKHGDVSLENLRNDVFLYHLRVLQVLKQAQREEKVRAYHLALLRQVMESVSSFLGVGRTSGVLKRIGFENADETARIVNTLTHKNVYYYESDRLVPDNLEWFNEILDRLNTYYKFVTHDAEP